MKKRKKKKKVSLLLGQRGVLNCDDATREAGHSLDEASVGTEIDPQHGIPDHLEIDPRKSKESTGRTQVHTLSMPLRNARVVFEREIRPRAYDCMQNYIKTPIRGKT